MLRRRVFPDLMLMSLLLGALLAWRAAAPAFALSDADYKKMMRDSGFAQADKALNAAWKEAKGSLSGSDFESLKRDQRAWVKSGRDAEAKGLMRSQGLSRVQAYAAATNARAEYILQLARGVPDEDDAWPEEAVAQNDDLPDVSGARDDDLPDDLPSDEPQSPAPARKAAAKGRPAPTSPEEAASALEAHLMQLDRLSPGDTLSYLETQVEHGGERCWEFSAQSEGLNTLVETGRYAVSPSGKFYEFDGDKYVPVKK